jgi:hypothetical protein
MSALFHSRKFLVAIMDAFLATLAIALTWWLSPENVKQALVLVGIWQPVFVAVIYGITTEDAAAYDAFSHPNQVALPKPSETK